MAINVKKYIFVIDIAQKIMGNRSELRYWGFLGINGLQEYSQNDGKR
jgi:hypothetical protein